MPLKIVAGRSKKTKSLYIRGSYLGVAVDASCRTDRRSVARGVLKRFQKQIERGEYPPHPVTRGGGEPTFMSAAIAYMEAGRSARYVAPLIKHFGETPLSEIDQAAIDDAAIALKPNVSNATRNVCVYTPVVAIMHHAGVDIRVRRPKGAKGRVLTDWLAPADAFGIIGAAETALKEVEFAVLLAFLLYTGPRIGGALNLQREDVRIDEMAAWARPQKGQMPNDVRLSEEICARLAKLLESHDRRRVFRWHYGGHLKWLLIRAKLAYLGLPCPVRRPKGWRQPPNRLQFVTFHTFRHTWATWMRRYGRVDVKGLVATNNWRDERSASRYAHAVPREEWDRVEQLPSMGKSRGVA